MLTSAFITPIDDRYLVYRLELEEEAGPELTLRSLPYAELITTFSPVPVKFERIKKVDINDNDSSYLESIVVNA